jgi:hypothetical protein
MDASVRESTTDDLDLHELTDVEIDGVSGASAAEALAFFVVATYVGPTAGLAAFAYLKK